MAQEIISDKKQIENLQYRRKDSRSRLSKWILYQDAYSGNGGFENGSYLKQGTREGSDYYINRKQSPTYLNLFMPSVEKYHGWLTTGPEPIIEASPAFSQFIKDAKLIEHIRQLSRIALINGIGHGVIDAPFEAIGKPYLVSYTPQDLFNWEEKQDEGGEATGFYNQAKIGIETVEVDVSKAGELKSEEFFLWKPGESQRWKIIEDTAARVGTKKNNYDKAPLVTLSFVLGETSTNKISIFDSLARVSKRLFNVFSEMEAYEANHLIHAMMAIPEPPGMGGESGNANSIPNQEESWGGTTDDSNSPNPYKYIMKANVITYDPTDGGKPEMLYGDVSALTEWRELIGELIEWAAYVSGIRGPAAYLHPKSGEAYKQEFIDTRAILKTFAKQIEGYIHRLAAIWEMVTGGNAALTKVEWQVAEPDNDVLELDKLIQMSMSEAAESRMFLNEVRKEIARLITRGDREMQANISEEIDNLPIDAGEIPAIPVGSEAIETT